MNAILIRQAEMDDLDQLSHLFDAYRIFYRQPSDIIAARNFLKERVANKESIIYIAINSSRNISGFTQLYPLFSSTRMKRLWLLNDLYVMESSRGQGISTLLIGKAKELAKETGAAGILLETEKSNVIGNNLYPKVGFELENETNFYFWQNNA